MPGPRTARRPGLKLRLVRLVGLLALLVGTAACQLEVDVGVDVGRDGAGQVQVGVALDADAAREVPELADQLEVDDLVRGGWTVTGPTVEGDGRTWVRAAKPFATPEEAASILAELTGASGPFRDFHVERSRSRFAETWRFAGEVDLSAGLRDFSDDALRARLDGTSFGATDAELEARAGRPLAQAVRFRVEVGLPGAVEANTPVQVGGRAVWTPLLGERTSLLARGRVLDGRRVVSLVVAGLAGAALLGVLGWRFAVRHR